jgi:hypothetical protein
MPEETSHEAQVVQPGGAPHVDAIASQLQNNPGVHTIVADTGVLASALPAAPSAPAPLPVVVAPPKAPAGPVMWTVRDVPEGVTFGVSPNPDGTSALVITIAEGSDACLSKAYTAMIKGLNEGWKSRLPVIVGARGGTRDNLTGLAVPPPSHTESAQASRPIAPPAVPPPNARRAAQPQPQSQPAFVPPAPIVPPRPTNEGLSMSRRAIPQVLPRQPHASPSMARLLANQRPPGEK